MKKVICLAAFSLLAACAPDEGPVCERLQAAYGNSTAKPGYLKSEEACRKHFKHWAKRYGINSYRRLAECYKKSDTAFAMRACDKAENLRVQ